MKSELKLGQMRIPDILETIADLSNDEVFTPPDLANKVLDMLPKEIWSNSTITFLDPACKTGVFLREITKRLIEGLKDEIPDLQTRVNHILTKQVFGLGITELTALMSRRTVYCATKANSDASVCTAFDDSEGNIKFPKSKHNFNQKAKKCEICGAGEDLYGEIPGLDNYAYSLLHDDLKEVFGNVKFDVIIGNPPYQLNVGNESSTYAIAIYHKFIDAAINLNPKYISMIVPSRWMSNNAEGIPTEWVEKMIKSRHLKEIHDFPDSSGLFKSVDISGGVNYFLWDKEHSGKCNIHYYDKNEVKSYSDSLNRFSDSFIVRNPSALEVLKKVIKIEKEYYNNDNFSGLVGPSHFFDKNGILSSNWKGYVKEQDELHLVKFYVNKTSHKIDYGWIKESDIPKNKEAKDIHKVFISGLSGKVMYGEPNSVCSQTYQVIGYDHKKHNFTKKQCENIISYAKTKFFRFLVNIKKTALSAPRGVYQFAPLQDWSKPWTDAELYEKYKLTPEEIAYIEENIEEMK